VAAAADAAGTKVVVATLSTGVWERPNVVEAPGQVSATRAAVLLGRSRPPLPTLPPRAEHALTERFVDQTKLLEDERRRNAAETRPERLVLTLASLDRD